VAVKEACLNHRATLIPVFNLGKLLMTVAFAALVVICMIGQPIKSGGGKNQPSDRNRPPTITTYAYDANCCTKQEAPKVNDDSFRWSTALKRSEWWLFLATVATLLVIGYQTMQTKRAADAANKSAAAALLNAQAVINAERAWISVTPHEGSPKFYPIRDKGAPVPDDLVDVLPIAHLFAGKLVNVGQTPAKIEGARIRYIRTPMHPSRLEADPDYGDIAENGLFVFPDEVNTISAELSPVATLTQTQIEAVQNGDEFLYAFGIV